MFSNRCRVCMVCVVLEYFVQIREETDTKIELPSEKSNSDVIVITGKKDRVEKAKQMLLKMEENLVRQVK